MGSQLKMLRSLPQGQMRQGEGGRRCQDYYEINSEERPLITVITIVYNGRAFLEKTILSVINQNCKNFEYIIIDGGSSDGTLDIVRKYENAIDYWVSERDQGIYDAMSKGISLSSGMWINFMNAGDCFFSPDTLLAINFPSKLSFDMIYGDYGIQRPKRIVKKTVYKPNELWKGGFCHQSMFVSKSLLVKYPFNSDLKICSDSDLVLKIINGDYTVRKLDVIMAVIAPGGLSDVSRLLSVKEQWRITRKYKMVNLIKIDLFFLRLYLKNVLLIIFRKIGFFKV